MPIDTADEASPSDLNALIAKTKEIFGELDKCAKQMIPDVRGPVTDPVRAESARFKESLAQSVHILEQRNIELPDDVYEFLRKPNFLAHDRLQDASRIIVSVAQSLSPGQPAARAALLSIAQDLEMITARTALVQLDEPLAQWVDTKSAYAKRAQPNSD
ncbi:Uncharacterised protein [Mycobacteroides abscessus subsp. abscessus]|uniref:hypothetical protein n=1 Tax=Mycobacteroides abscessus TaxID=36809 RepID=UPI000926E811|nr:hypothetical protein [Mycobacteroides abscessus]SIC59928.1 Uncharacterised protein [Mycobacteroides abscessus subsp. abscessus]SIC91955.1 Uncharacterised protein [Mycobacteroides abscessus subsp. abscessus]SID11753.1 Uncharacterised protein [Mycobacteroides abscessus subsp. abscessus]SID17353.1 Uncharacterised protein [Mycobacteroides abscessus subsp. abscessus]SKV99795.1 Uncharacterised protein [Mycobacteroides abscessus subsp. abscessus]